MSEKDSEFDNDMDADSNSRSCVNVKLQWLCQHTEFKQTLELMVGRMSRLSFESFMLLNYHTLRLLSEKADPPNLTQTFVRNVINAVAGKVNIKPEHEKQQQQIFNLVKQRQIDFDQKKLQFDKKEEAHKQKQKAEKEEQKQQEKLQKQIEAQQKNQESKNKRKKQKIHNGKTEKKKHVESVSGNQQTIEMDIMSEDSSNSNFQNLNVVAQSSKKNAIVEDPVTALLEKEKLELKAEGTRIKSELKKARQNLDLQELKRSMDLWMVERNKSSLDESSVQQSETNVTEELKEIMSHLNPQQSSLNINNLQQSDQDSVLTIIQPLSPLPQMDGMNQMITFLSKTMLTACQNYLQFNSATRLLRYIQALFPHEFGGKLKTCWKFIYNAFDYVAIIKPQESQESPNQESLNQPRHKKKTSLEEFGEDPLISYYEPFVEWIKWFPSDKNIKENFSHFLKIGYDIQCFYDAMPKDTPKIKRFSILPLQRGFQLKHIFLDSAALQDTIAKMFHWFGPKGTISQNANLEIGSHKSITEKFFKQNKDFFWRTLFPRIIKVGNESRKLETRNRKFKYLISTDGYSCSVHFEQSNPATVDSAHLEKLPSESTIATETTNKSRKRKQAQIKNQEQQEEMDQQYQNSNSKGDSDSASDEHQDQDQQNKEQDEQIQQCHSELQKCVQDLCSSHSFRLFVGVDPGIGDLFTACDQNGYIIRGSNKEYRHLAQMDKQRFWNDNLRKRFPKYQEILNKLKLNSLKVSCPNEFLQHAMFYLQYRDFLFDFSEQQAFRKWRFKVRIYSQKALHKFCQRICTLRLPREWWSSEAHRQISSQQKEKHTLKHEFDCWKLTKQEVLVGFGNWSLGYDGRSGFIKGNDPAPVKKFLRALVQYAMVVMIDEFRTSKACWLCGGDCKESHLPFSLSKKQLRKREKQRKQMDEHNNEDKDKPMDESTTQNSESKSNHGPSAKVSKCRKILYCTNNKCGKYRHRDHNGARNILGLLKGLRDGLPRPSYLSRLSVHRQNRERIAAEKEVEEQSANEIASANIATKETQRVVTNANQSISSFRKGNTGCVSKSSFLTLPQIALKHSSQGLLLSGKRRLSVDASCAQDLSKQAKISYYYRAKQGECEFEQYNLSKN